MSVGAIRVAAEGDEDEDEEFWNFWEKKDDDRKYKKDDDRYEKYQAKIPATASKTVAVPERSYDTARATQTFQEMRDSDGDGLADIYDRYPGRNDLLYVMDSDHDGVSDAEDKHPGDNDFIYALSDANENGIADDVEGIIRGR